MMIAQTAELASRFAPLKLFLRKATNELLTLTLAQTVALVLMNVQ
jgi:hypothetical protein